MDTNKNASLTVKPERRIIISIGVRPPLKSDKSLSNLIQEFPALYSNWHHKQHLSGSIGVLYRSARYAVELIGFSFRQNIKKEDKSCRINESTQRTDWRPYWNLRGIKGILKGAPDYSVCIDTIRGKGCKSL